MAKIQTLETLARTVGDLKRRGKTVALCHGCFDLMHPGHIQHLQAAKALADVLVVTVTPDEFVAKGQGRPAFPEALRAEAIGALAAVDYVAVNAWPTAEETLRLLRPTYYVKGEEFQHLQDKTGKIQREYEVAREVGTQVRFTGGIVFSSTRLLNEYPTAMAPEDRTPLLSNTLPEATQQHLARLAGNYSFEDVVAQLQRVEKLKVLLVGDGIVDEYHYCASMGRSPKAPLVVYQYRTHEEHAGGALAIANHASGMCGRLHLVTLLGNHDSREEFIRANLAGNVEPKFFYREDGPTVIKKRYLDYYLGQKVFEVNYLNNRYVDEQIESEVVDYLAAIVPQYDMVMVSDFGHGFITGRVYDVLRRGAKLLAVNSQTNAANVGFNLITKYNSPDFVCIDEIEARLATQDRFGAVDGLARRVLDAIHGGCLIVTVGKGGSVAVNAHGCVEHCPIFSTRVIDTVGAGDAFFTFSSLAFAAGAPLDLVSFVGNVVGALKVQIIGNKRSVSRAELLDLVRELLTIGAEAGALAR